MKKKYLLFYYHYFYSLHLKWIFHVEYFVRYFLPDFEQVQMHYYQVQLLNY